MADNAKQEFENTSMAMPIVKRQTQDGRFLEDVKAVTKFIKKFVLQNFDAPIAPIREPGYVVNRFETSAPETPKSISELTYDFEEIVGRGMLHWNHPLNFGFLPAGNSLPNIYGDMLSTSIGGVGFSWTAQPSLTELENLMLDWLSAELALPAKFSFTNSKGIGGGSIQNSGTDAIFNTMVVARYQKLKALGPCGQKKSTCTWSELPIQLLDTLVCFASSEAHSSVKKAAHIAMVECVLIATVAPLFSLTKDQYRRAILKSRSQGKTPFYTVLSLGTAGCCAIDDIPVLAKMCKDFGMWCHVNASYAGNSFIVKQYRVFAAGLEYADSINVSPYKMMLGAPDLACLWVDNTDNYVEPWLMEATYLINKYANATEKEIILNTIDYRNYGVPLTRRMRALKLFSVFRMYGMEPLRSYITTTIGCAEVFSNLVRTDDRFELMNVVYMGVVVFRQRDLRNENNADALNLNLLARLQKNNYIFITPCHIGIHFALRFSVNHEFANPESVRIAWHLIQKEYVALMDRVVPALDQFIVKPSAPVLELMTRSHLRPVDEKTYNKAVVEGFRYYEEDFGPIIVKVDNDLLNMYETFTENRHHGV